MSTVTTMSALSLATGETKPAGELALSPSEKIESIAFITEAKLTEIIFAARKIAVLAEEVMRENVTNGAATSGRSILHHSPELTMRLLTATEEQLNSILAMSRQDGE